jgi:iron(III) transport system permease protein
VLVVVVLLAPVVLAWLPHGAATAREAGPSPPVPWTPLVASLAVAAAAAVLAVIVGGALAALLVLTDFPGRPFWATVALLPFVCPPMVWAIGQVYCYGPGGLVERWCGSAWRAVQACSDPGHYAVTTLVLAQIHAPLAMLIVGRGLRQIHTAGLESARLFLSRRAMIGWTARAVRPEAAAALLLSMALSLGNFAVPHVLQCRLYTMEIYVQMANYLDHAAAMWTSLPLVGAAVLAAAGMAIAERRARYVSAEPSPPPVPIRLGWKVWPAGGLLMLYLGLSGALPLAAMVYECQSPGCFFDAVSAAAVETQNTLWIGAAAAGVAALAGLAVGVWAATRARLAIDVLAIIPIGLPPMLLGLAYLRFYNRTWPVNLAVLGSSSALVILALAARGWPFVTRAVAAGRRRIAPEWHEAARLGLPAGGGSQNSHRWAGTLARWRWITLPLLADSLAVGAVVAFILAVGDVQITQMLCVPGTGTLALRLFTFLHFGPTHVAASLALLQLSLCAVPLLVYFLVTSRWLQIV